MEPTLVDLLGWLADSAYLASSALAQTSRALTVVFFAVRVQFPFPTQTVRLLFLTPVTPNAEGIGIEQRAWFSLVSARRHFEVDVIVISNDPDNPARHYPVILPRKTWLWRWQRGMSRRHPRLWEKLTGRPARFPRPTLAEKDKFRRLLTARPYDVIHAFRLEIAPWAWFAHAHLRPASRELWLDPDDIESVAADRLSQLALPAAYLAEARRTNRGTVRSLARFEEHWVRRFDRVFACSVIDLKHWRERFPQARLRLLPNQAPEEPSADFTSSPVPRTGGPLFIGSLRYGPNIDAVYRLCKYIWPLLENPAHHPLTIAGVGAGTNLERLCRATPGAEYLGAVATSRPLFQRAKLLLVPLRSGAGTRIKILQAFAWGCPVISSKIGIEGIEASPEIHYLAAETDAEFVAQVQRIYQHPELPLRLAAAAAEWVQIHHGSSIVNAAFSPDSTDPEVSR